MHQNKGKSIADCLADRTDYAKNSDKTNDGEPLSSYECDPRTIQGEFMLSKRQYDDITGREQKSGKHYAFKGAEQKKFIRLRSLGEDCLEDEIQVFFRLGTF